MLVDVDLAVEPKAPHADCAHCPYKNQPFVPSYGPPPAETVATLVGEGPGHKEVEQGRPFVGPSGHVNRTVLRSVGVDPNKVFWCNATGCLPTDDKEHTLAQAVACCRPRLLAELAERNVTEVIAVGGPAAVALGATNSSITAIRGRRFTNADGIVVGPTIHPAWILRTDVSKENPNNLHDFRRDLAYFTDVRPLPLPDVSYLVVDSCEEAIWQIDAMRQEVWWDKFHHEKDTLVALDFENANLNPYSELLCAVLTHKPGWALILTDAVLHDRMVKEALFKLFEEPGCLLCGVNVKHDWKVMRAQWGKTHDFYLDAMACHVTVDERVGGHSLEVMATQEFELPDNWKQDLEDWFCTNGMKDKDKRDYSLVPKPMLYEYCATDGDLTLRLTQNFVDSLLSEKLLKLALDYTAFQHVAAEMEFTGVLISPARREEIGTDLTERTNALLTELIAHVGTLGLKREVSKRVKKETIVTVVPLEDDFKLGKNGSTGDVRFVLEALLSRLPRKAQTKRTPKSLQLSTNEKDLAYLYGLSTDLDLFLKLLEDYREVTKLNSTYVQNIKPDAANRVHSSFNVFGQVSGRPSSSDPNLLNIPRDQTAYGKWLRRMYVAPEGCSTIVCDYSQLELRVLGWYSNEPNLLEPYKAGKDLHRATALDLFRREVPADPGAIDWSELPWDRYRSIGKTTNFNIHYALGSINSTREKLKKDKIELTDEEAKEIERTMKGRMGTFLDWANGPIKRQMIEQGYVESAINGRRRRFGWRQPGNEYEFLKLAVNHLGQSASDLTWYSMVDVRPILPDFKSKLLLHWFDAMWLEVPNEYVKTVGKLVLDTMVETAYRYFGRDKLPFAADLKAGPDWASLQKIKL